MDLENIKQINNIISLLNNNFDGYSIRELSEILQVPIELIKQDMKHLLDNEEFNINLFPDIDFSDDYDEFDNDIKWFAISQKENSAILSLTSLELMSFKLFINNIKESISKKKYEKINLVIKNNFNSMNDEQKRFLRIIEKALKKENVITLSYRNKQDKVNVFDVCPIGIVYYEFESLWYMVGYWKEMIFYYRLDRIKNVVIKNITFEYPDNFNMRESMANLWGMELGEEYKVKVKFKNDYNLVEKLKRDLYNRKNAKLYTKDKYIIYEDRVIGINNFKMWVRGFGSDAIVIEPKEVRDDILNSAKEMYEYYRDEKKCPS